jgi:hypothetical protein
MSVVLWGTIKYRMRGEYKVEGAEKLCRDYAAHHENWSVIWFLFVSTLWDRLLGYLFFALLHRQRAAVPCVVCVLGTLQRGLSTCSRCAP